MQAHCRGPLKRCTRAEAESFLFIIRFVQQNLREVALFPMNQRAEDLLMGAPSEATTRQLRELHLRLNLPQT